MRANPDRCDNATEIEQARHDCLITLPFSRKCFEAIGRITYRKTKITYALHDRNAQIRTQYLTASANVNNQFLERRKYQFNVR